MSKPENPPLFEYEYDGQNNVLHSSAITLRDLFAAAALPQIQRQAAEESVGVTRSEIAAEAGRMADAMLEEREKQ